MTVHFISVHSSFGRILKYKGFRLENKMKSKTSKSRLKTVSEETKYATDLASELVFQIHLVALEV